MKFELATAQSLRKRHELIKFSVVKRAALGDKCLKIGKNGDSLRFTGPRDEILNVFAPSTLADATKPDLGLVKNGVFGLALIICRVVLVLLLILCEPFRRSGVRPAGTSFA